LKDANPKSLRSGLREHYVISLFSDESRERAANYAVGLPVGKAPTGGASFSGASFDQSTFTAGFTYAGAFTIATSQ